MAFQPVGFDHEGLDAYRLAIDALSLAAGMTRGLPYDDRFLRGQLLRALTSVCFNLAEGFAESSAGDRKRFLRMARRSAAESAAIVDALRVLCHFEPEAANRLKRLLHRTSSMLTRLINRAG